MTPRGFDYYAPTSLQEATSLLKRNEDSKVLAGGQSLVAMMKLRLASPAVIVDITKLKDISYIKEDKTGAIRIGALTTHDTVENSDLLKKKYRVLSEAATKIGDQQIRNRGTIGGSICHADASADLPPAILALEAEMVAHGPNGERVIKAKDFFVDFFTTALTQHEILTEIRLPPQKSNTVGAYIKHSRREGDFAIVGVATVLNIDGGGTCKKAAIGLASVAPTPIRSSKVEKELIGKNLNAKSIDAASTKAKLGIAPLSDIHGSSEYRIAMAEVFTKRTIKLALSRLKGGI